MKTKKNLEAVVQEKLALEEKRIREELERLNPDAVQEVPGGWDTLLNKHVLILSAGYFYIGTLTGVNGSYVQLSDAHVIYDVDNFDPKKWKPTMKDKLPGTKWYIERAAVESFGEY